MRLFPVTSLQGGEIIAKNIMDIKGNRLLAKNTSYKPYYAEKLLTRGIEKIYIADKESEGIKVKDVISERVRNETLNRLKDQITIFKARQQIDVQQLQISAIQIVEDVLSNKQLLYDIVDIKSNDNYTYEHSINVSVLCVMLGRKLKKGISFLIELAIGALLHDFGKILIDEAILNKATLLTTKEFEIIKQHPMQGYNIFKDNPNLMPISKVMILLHHEQVNGTGYPLGLTKEKVHESARICAISDVFDAMTSKRSYRDAITILETLREMEKMTHDHLDEDLFKLFRGMVSYYPVGTTVLLNTGFIAIVEQNRLDKIDNPVVRIIFDLRYQEEIFKRMDLSQHKDIHILRELLPEEYKNNHTLLKAIEYK